MVFPVVVELAVLIRVAVVDEVAAAADRVVMVGFTGSRLGEVVLSSLFRVEGPSF